MIQLAHIHSERLNDAQRLAVTADLFGVDFPFKLEPTGGKWEARTFEVEAAQDYPAVIVLQNVSDASGNSLSVRKVELVPVGGKPTAAPSAAADDRLAYSLDLTGQKAFAVRRKARDTVDFESPVRYRLR